MTQIFSATSGLTKHIRSGFMQTFLSFADASHHNDKPLKKSHETSARNQFQGTIIAIESGPVTTEVILEMVRISLAVTV